MRGKVVSLCLILASTGLAWAGEMKATRRQHPLSPNQIKDLGGFAGRRYRANQDGYLKTFDIDLYVKMVTDRTHEDWWWIGEQDGKWIESAVLTSELTGDQALRRQAKDVLARIIATQEPGGYVGITPAKVRTAEQPLRGMDPYELYFTLHSFITAYEEWGDKAALKAARKLGDYFVDTIGPGKAEFWPSPHRPPQNVNTIVCPQVTWVPEGTPRAPELHVHSPIAGHTAHYGWEGTLLIDPMLRLYQVGGGERYLDWSRWVIANIDKWSGWDAFSNLDKVADGSMGVHELQPYVHAHTFQMNFEGFLRMYQITGDESYLRKVAGAWQDIAGRQMYITGGVSVGEHYEPGHRLPITGHVVETCASMSWIEVTQYLLELTGEAKYADAIERLLWNHLYAAQTVDGDCNRYHTPLNGAKPAGYYHGPNCCTSSGHRLQSKVPLLIYGAGEKGLYVNQFVASEAQLKLPSGNTVTIHQETGYPTSEKVVMHVTPRKRERFKVFVRIPAWCEDAALKVNGKVVSSVRAGTYVPVRRRWEKGDRIELTLPMRPRWVKGSDTTDGMLALVRGPMVYALDSVWWDTEDATKLGSVEGDLSQVAFLESVESSLTEVPAPSGALGPAYRTKVRLLDGTVIEPTLMPFANTGQWYRPGSATRPGRNDAAFHYAVWLRDTKGPVFKEAAKRRRDAETRKAKRVDFVQPGDADSEQAHDLQSEKSAVGRFNGRPWRHAADGWFSYKMKVLPDVPLAVECTYWGSDIGAREFDIVVDGRTIATQTLAQNRPHRFYSERYPIPTELSEGKHGLTVRFQAHAGKTAGGVFGCAIVKMED